MNQKLSWDEIKQKYSNEWVELIDYEWDEFETKPRFGVVRDHDKERKNLHSRFMQLPIENSAIVFTGQMQIDKNVSFSANLHQFTVKGELIIY